MRNLVIILLFICPYVFGGTVISSTAYKDTVYQSDTCIYLNTEFWEYSAKKNILTERKNIKLGGNYVQSVYTFYQLLNFIDGEIDELPELYTLDDILLDCTEDSQNGIILKFSENNNIYYCAIYKNRIIQLLMQM
jgi:hypothetical protein